MNPIEKQRKKCEEFLLLNGWEKEIYYEDYFTHYNKSGNFSVDIGSEEIVFIGDYGNFCELPINYYALIGALFEFHAIAIDYKAVK